MARTVLVPVADGTEELEAVAIIDTLRRAGAVVTVATIGAGLEITCSRGVRLVADTRIADLGAVSFDLIALPGGMPGAEHLHDSQDLTALLNAHVAAGGLIAAICAAPVVVLARRGLLGKRRATAHPSVFAELPESQRSEDRVVVDEGLVTSRGAGTALEFALTLVEQLFGPERRDDVARSMLA
jgi:4-methyl-5(b-hydroxyethyl)-thiazole monophosphate biosynthesis